MSIDRRSWSDFWSDRTDGVSEAFFDESQTDFGSSWASAVGTTSASSGVGGTESSLTLGSVDQAGVLADGSTAGGGSYALTTNVDSGSGFSLASSVLAYQAGGGIGAATMPVSCSCCGALGSTTINGLSAGAGSGQDSITASAPGTLQQLADYLKQGYWAFAGSNFNWKWGISNITFNVQALTTQERIWAREAFNMVSRVANLTFTEVSSGGNITFVSPDSGQPNYGSAFANFGGSSGNITSATVSISADWAGWSASNPFYNYYFQTYVHEIGHALGLGHQGAYNGSASYPTNAVYDNDSWQLSVMSYFDQVENTYAGLNGSFAYVSSYMQADILALQDKYGAPANAGTHYFGFAPTVSGSGFNSGANFGARSFTMYSADGYVFLDTSDSSSSQTIRMGSGQFSSIYGFTDNVSQYASTMTGFLGGSGADDVTLAGSAPVAAGNIFASGNGGNDIFRSTGSTTNTSIDGGAGTDTYTRTLLALNTDVTLRRTSQSGNGWTVDSPSNDHFLTNVETAQFSNTTVSLRQARSNFNFGYANDAGATSDFVLWNPGSAYIGTWTIQNNTLIGGTTLSNSLPGWAVVGTGDFNADGTSDVLLQSGGSIVNWQLKNGTIQAGFVVTTGAAGWTVKGTGDVNNDGTYDIVLQNGGTVVDWRMNNGVFSAGTVISTGAAGWNVVGVGDFNNNGHADVLLQNGNAVVSWSLLNGAYSSGSVLSANTAGFNVVGTGDFDGDGDADVILQNGGSFVEWTLQNGAYQTGHVLAVGANGYSVAGTGDYNGDGVADVAIGNGSGLVVWTLQNGSYTSGSVIAGSGLNGWQVIG